jgi:hypothetical protein
LITAHTIDGDINVVTKEGKIFVACFAIIGIWLWGWAAGGLQSALEGGVAKLWSKLNVWQHLQRMTNGGKGRSKSRSLREEAVVTAAGKLDNGPAEGEGRLGWTETMFDGIGETVIGE